MIVEHDGHAALEWVGPEPVQDMLIEASHVKRLNGTSYHMMDLITCGGCKLVVRLLLSSKDGKIVARSL